MTLRAIALTAYARCHNRDNAADLAARLFGCDSSERPQDEKGHFGAKQEGEPCSHGSGTGGLSEYSEHELENWRGSKRIVVYNNEIQLDDFVRKAQEDKQFTKRMYLGKIGGDVADRIKRETGVDVEGYNVSISADEVRKIFRDHGDQESESLRGQRGIEPDDFHAIRAIVEAPDSISLSNKTYREKPVIIFTKRIDGRMHVVTYASDRHRNLSVQTMYAGKKKGPIPGGK